VSEEKVYFSFLRVLKWFIERSAYEKLPFYELIHIHLLLSLINAQTIAQQLSRQFFIRIVSNSSLF